ncbi:MAG: hypothetical protein Q7S55_00225 [Nanoarchaeota archaeon]|nr:hypothetical protein [Nanoarchaeota archaeon]
MADTKYYNYIKKKLLREKGPDVKALGYNLSCGFGKQEGTFSLEARLQPLPGSPDPISDDIFARIKNDLEKYLQDHNENVPLNIIYIGLITAR